MWIKPLWKAAFLFQSPTPCLGPISVSSASPRLLLDGAPLIAIHKARYYKRKDGLALGPGPFVSALEFATDSTATVVGKPEKTFFLEALRGTGYVPEEAVMIGDVSRGTQEIPWAPCLAYVPWLLAKQVWQWVNCSTKNLKLSDFGHSSQCDEIHVIQQTIKFISVKCLIMLFSFNYFFDNAFWGSICM